MIRLTKITDYGIVLLTHIARRGWNLMYNTRDLAQETHIPLPMVSKILKALTREGILVSHRGVKGGYSLSRPPEDISVADIVMAMEGPIGITECTGGDSHCDLEYACPVSRNWQRINRTILGALRSIALSEMAQPLHNHALVHEGAVRAERLAPGVSEEAHGAVEGARYRKDALVTAGTAIAGTR